MMPFSSRVVLLATLAITFAVQASEPVSETQAVATILKVGGAVQRDEALAGKPVVGVTYNEDTIEPDLSLLASFPKLKSLRVTCLPLTPMMLKHIKPVSSLEDLSLYGSNGVDKAALRELRTLPRLRKLTIDLSQIDDEQLQLIAALPAIEEVTLHGSIVTDKGIATAQKAKQRLKIDAGNRNTAEKRVRRALSISAAQELTAKSIEASLLARIPLKSSEKAIRTELQKCGFGKDDHSSISSIENQIICRVDYDPKSGDIVHKHFAFLFQMDAKDQLTVITVKAWYTGL